MRRGPQRIDHRADREAHARLTQIAIPCAQPIGFLGDQFGGDDQAVEGVILARAIGDGGHGGFDGGGVLGDGVDVAALRQGQQKIVDRAQHLARRIADGGQDQFGRQGVNHAKAEMFQCRYRARQRQRALALIDFQPHPAICVAGQAVQPHPSRGLLRGGQRAQTQQVNRRLVRTILAAIGLRKSLGIAGGECRGAARMLDVAMLRMGMIAGQIVAGRQL